MEKPTPSSCVRTEMCASVFISSRARAFECVCVKRVNVLHDFTCICLGDERGKHPTRIFFW